MPDTQVADPIKAQMPEDVVLLDSSNFNDFVNKSLPAPDEDIPVDDPEAKAKDEFAKMEAEKAEKAAAEEAEKKAKEDPTHELGDEVGAEKKNRLNERFRKQTEARKAAEAEAQREREARATLERELAQLKAQHEKPADELEPEPQPDQFRDASEYVSAIKEWTAKKTERDVAARVAQEARVKTWNERRDAVKKEFSDYEEAIAQAPAVPISNELRDAIFESDAGPMLQYHLAKNPRLLDEIRAMPVGRMYKAIGKLEAELSGARKAESKADEKPMVKASAAPEPITPTKGTGSGVGITLRGHDPVPPTMSWDQWNKLWQAGKIK